LIGGLQKGHFDESVTPEFGLCKQFKEFHQPDFKATTGSKDNCVLLDNDVLVRNFISISAAESKEAFVVFHKYMNLPSFYRHPIDSRDLNVYCVSV
jgi:hypothetical protein